MRKFLTIGDIHGRTCWKKFADIDLLLAAEPEAAGYGAFVPEYDKYIFLADYVDSYTETNQTIRENLLEIIKFVIVETAPAADTNQAIEAPLPKEPLSPPPVK